MKKIIFILGIIGTCLILSLTDAVSQKMYVTLKNGTALKGIVYKHDSTLIIENNDGWLFYYKESEIREMKPVPISKIISIDGGQGIHTVIDYDSSDNKYKKYLRLADLQINANWIIDCMGEVRLAIELYMKRHTDIETAGFLEFLDNCGIKNIGYKFINNKILKFALAGSEDCLENLLQKNFLQYECQAKEINKEINELDSENTTFLLDFNNVTKNIEEDTRELMKSEEDIRKMLSSPGGSGGSGCGCGGGSGGGVELVFKLDERKDLEERLKEKLNNEWLRKLQLIHDMNYNIKQKSTLNRELKKIQRNIEELKKKMDSLNEEEQKLENGLD